jgi:hypothetical protein
MNLFEASEKGDLEFLIRSMKYKNHISDDIFFLENPNEALDSLYDELNANIVLKL